MDSFEFCGYEIETPLVNAAGSISGTNPELIKRETEMLAATAIGIVTVGSFTVPSQIGNERKHNAVVYYYDKDTRTTYNSMGLPNIGIAAAKLLLPELVEITHENGKPIIASISPTIPDDKIGDPLMQTIRMLEELDDTGVDMIEINVSCPNIVMGDGSRKPILGHDFDSMQEFIRTLAPILKIFKPKTGIKLPPYLTPQQKLLIPGIAAEINNDSGLAFATTSNTIANQKPVLPNGKNAITVPGGLAGMSGPSTAKIGRQQLIDWRRVLKDSIEINSQLGVNNGSELALRRKRGASVAGGVSFLWESPNWGMAVTDVLTDWAEHELV